MQDLVYTLPTNAQLCAGHLQKLVHALQSMRNVSGRKCCQAAQRAFEVSSTAATAQKPLDLAEHAACVRHRTTPHHTDNIACLS
jgi:hypothetical protein